LATGKNVQRPRARIADEQRAIVGPGGTGTGHRDLAGRTCFIANKPFPAVDRAAGFDEQRAAARGGNQERPLAGPGRSIPGHRDFAGGALYRADDAVMIADRATILNKQHAGTIVADVHPCGIDPTGASACDRDLAS
jgi:hypothetical protein